jgi:hypothetical protein
MQIYKPQKNGNGCACNLYVSRHGSLNINFIQQFSWDDKNRTGSFSENRNVPEKNASIKFNEFECGEIIHAIQAYKPWNAYHSFGDNKTKISLTTWAKGDVPMFGISIDQNGRQFKLPLTMGEAVCIRIMLEAFVLRKVTEDRLKDDA